MIIGTRQSPFLNSNNTVDSSATIEITGHESGSSYYPLGNRFSIPQDAERLMVVERKGNVIIERYFIKWVDVDIHERVLCQIMVKIIPLNMEYNDGDVIVLLDSQGIQNALKLYNYQDVKVEFLNNILFKCVSAEFSMENPAVEGALYDWTMDAKHNTHRSLDPVESLNWNVAPFLNYPGRIPHRSVNPYHIAANIDETARMVNKGDLNINCVRYDIEDQFIPRAEMLFPNPLSNRLMVEHAISTSDITKYAELNRINPLIKYPSKFDISQLQKNSQCITTCIDGWMDLCDMAQYIKLSDYSLEYILPRCKLMEGTGCRYHSQVTHSHITDMNRLIVNHIIGVMFPGIRHFRFHKTYDQIIILEVLENNKVVYTYSADLIVAALLNHALIHH